MKMTYIAPAQKVAEIETEALIAQSPSTHDEVGNKSILSKGQSMWDNANSGDITSSNAWDDEEDW